MTADTSTSDRITTELLSDLWLDEPRYALREVVVQPPDELDVATQDAFATAVDWACASDAERVVVDFATVTFCGAAGLGILVLSASSLRTTGRVLEVRNPPPTLVRMSTLTGSAQLLGFAC